MKAREIIILGLIMLLVVVLTIIWNKTPDITKSVFDKNINKQITKNYRFQEIEEFPFCTQYGNETQAKIYLDTQTGIKYLYVWFGMANGGGTLTRLWEKDEK